MFDKLKIITFALSMSVAGAAQAAVIDFVNASNDGTTLIAADATVTAGAATQLFVGDFINNSVCPAGGDGCNGIMTVLFGFDVTNVIFQYGYGDEGDVATLSIRDALGALIGSVTLNSVSGVASADLTSFGSIRSILFDNSTSTGRGYAYGDINYVPASVVPLPASLPLLLAGLGGLALLRRRRQA
jgi:hypothetical protein